MGGRGYGGAMGEVWVEIFCDDSNFALHLPFLLSIVRLLFLCLRLSAVIVIANCNIYSDSKLSLAVAT